MYKIASLTLALFLFSTINALAQYTAGGSVKRYEEISKVTYDTIWNEKKIELPVGPKTGQRLAFGLIRMNSDYKGKMTETAYFTKPEYGAPIVTGDLAGKGGLFMEYGVYDPVNAVNKRLIPQLDLALYYNTDLGYMRYDLSYLEDYFTEGSVGQDLISDFYGSKWFAGFGFGPMLTYNIDKDEELYVDLLLQFKFSWSSSLYLYNYASGYDQAGNYDYYSLNITSDESSFDYNTLFGLNIRKDKFYVGIQQNSGFEEIRTYTEEFSFNSSYSTRYYLSNINLSHTRFVAGFHF